MSQANQTLLRTPCYPLHIDAGGKMIPYAGYEMPVQYLKGIKKEHLHTRANAGLFDISHMGQLTLTGKNAAKALESLIPGDIIDLPPGKQRYALFTNEQGGLQGDLMVTNLGDKFFIVVNAVYKAQNITYLTNNIPDDVEISILNDHALLALQGPKATAVLSRLIPESKGITFMDAQVVNCAGAQCIISRAGYTGEDGFEISIPKAYAQSISQRILAEPEVEWAGLGARDSLRLESGLCLYGHDIDSSTTPVEANLLWAISKVRRAGGAREGGFPGANIILKQIAEKNVEHKRVGMVGLGKTLVREGAHLYNEENKKIGVVTSGTIAPSRGEPIAMGYVKTAYAVLETKIYANVRGKKIPLQVQSMPFISQCYYRG